ncbi:alpha-galactosidase [Hufsiella ginkgonis]|uniref:Alpha-galactosidase n=1 Tax=Hufsiella ginkgonis TaxID=2695274 RepID=A0A7K1XZX1_9SPHI|nr:alpha-galactosidase [Hufsiella ginkgonis]MXV16564.1 alpha-galactosidase [Hufsiella ginkgonis]
MNVRCLLNHAKLLLPPLLMIISVTAHAQSTYIPIESRNNALVLQAEKGKAPRIIYFGRKLVNAAEYGKVAGLYRQGDDYSGVLNAAYTSSGTHNLVEPAVRVTHSDGNTSLDLQFVSSATQKLDDQVTLTSVLLRDPVYAFEATLFYKVYASEDVVEQWTVLSHQEKKAVTLHKFASANLYLKGEGFWLKQFHGDWAKEMQPEESQITHGIKVLDTKLGTRSHLYQPPFFIVSLGGPAQENEGKVLYGSVEWSGNFRVDLELDPLNNLRVIAGMNDFASEYSLKAGERFTTPAFLYTFSGHGTGEASRNLQRWARKYRVIDGNGSRFTLLNNWESTFFDFNEQKLAQLLKDTKQLGVDLFLLDDGWFGNQYPRNNDRAGLGDWQENKQKLPNGISSLVKEAEANGVKFGIWLEPEMVNPKSDLYLKHPGWVIKQPGRAEHLYRNQLVLDLSHPQVQDFVFNTVDGMFTRNPGLAYIKWDCNAVIYNAYSAHLEKQSHLYIEYVRGLYKVLERIRAKYPAVPMMLCSGGGGRVDYAALKYFTEFWPSDNTDPLERIFIQWEYSYFYPAITSVNHVTDWGKQPLKFKIDVAMMGKLGFDVDVSKLSPADLAFARQAVQTYSTIKDIVWHGDQYRLTSPWKSDFASVMYGTADKSSAVLFAYLVSNRYGAASKEPVVLKGLDAAKKYRVQEINLYGTTRSAIGPDAVYSGDFLMSAGINPVVNAGRGSVVLKIEEVR